MKQRRAGQGLILILLLALGLSSYAVESGDKAPPLSVSSWFGVDGSDVSVGKVTPGRSYLIAFPREDSPTAVSELYLLLARTVHNAPAAMKLSATLMVQSSKTVDILPVSPDKRVRLGVDQEGKSYVSYLQRGDAVPITFLVDEYGVIRWKGDPIESDTAVRMAVAGSLSQSKVDRIATLRRQLQTAVLSRVPTTAHQLADDILKLDPSNIFAAEAKLYLFEQEDKQAEALEFVRSRLSVTPKFAEMHLAGLRLLFRTDASSDQIETAAETMAEVFKDNHRYLSTLLVILQEEAPFGKCPVGVCLETAKQAIELAKQSETSVPSSYYGALARAYYAVGNLGLAATNQDLACKAALTEKERKDAESVFKFYVHILRSY